MSSWSRPLKHTQFDRRHQLVVVGVDGQCGGTRLLLSVQPPQSNARSNVEDSPRATSNYWISMSGTEAKAAKSAQVAKALCNAM